MRVHTHMCPYAVESVDFVFICFLLFFIVNDSWAQALDQPVPLNDKIEQINKNKRPL